MYTVLIQSKRTLECFQYYESLFHEDIEDGRIGICQWNREGTSIETALPELYDLIADKDRWRAVLVETEREDDAEFPTDRFNPYDHEYYREHKGFEIEDGKMKNSPVPIVRLSHLLGGIPAPDPEFEQVVNGMDDEGRIPYVEFLPIHEEEQKLKREAFERWTNDNTMKEAAPLEIVFIRVQVGNDQIDTEKKVRSSWNTQYESRSSEFWKRNLYPSCCRFIYYGMEQGGTVKRQADLFKLWTSVLLIAQNDIDPNVLQAHRLYRLDISIDREKLGYSLQESADKLNRARSVLEKSIAKDREIEKTGAESMPDIRLDIPVEFTNTTVGAINVDESEFHLTGGAASPDESYWKQYVEKVVTELKSILRNVDRNLDRASGQLRDLYGFTDAEVKTLSKYQEEDLRFELSETEGEIQKEQETLPERLPELSERIGEENARVEKEIKKRMDGKQFGAAVGIAIAAFIISLFPAFLIAENKLAPLLVGLAAAGAVALLGLIVLVIQRGKLLEATRDFEEKFRGIVRELGRNAVLYSDFLSDVATHTHGSTYVNTLDDRRRKRTGAYYRKLSYLKSVEHALGRIGMWSNAMKVPMNLNAFSISEEDEETQDMINFGTLYALDAGKDFKVELNKTGLYIKSPFGFVDTLEIVREGIYDSV